MLEFLLASVVVILLPGTGVLYTLGFGLSRGWRASAVAAFGCTLGVVPHIAASIIGLAAVLHTSAVAFAVVKYLGAAYLLYMAWSVTREGGALHISESSSPKSAAKVVMNGVLLNILNPKLSLFFLAFLPQFVPAGTPDAISHMLGLAAVFMLLTFMIFLGYGGLASAARRYVISRPGVMRMFKGAFAVAFGALAFRLAMSDR